jgi:hypothetical protein
LLQVGFDTLQPPRRHRADIPAVLDRICLKCLRKESAGRYASAAALADDLRAFREERPTTVHSPSFWERVRGWFRGMRKQP